MSKRKNGKKVLKTGATVINNRTNLIVLLICMLLPTASYGMEESIYQKVQALWDRAANEYKYIGDDLINDILISSLKTDDTTETQNEIKEAIKGMIDLSDRYNTKNCDVDALFINILNAKQAMAETAAQYDYQWINEKMPKDEWYNAMTNKAIELSKTEKINQNGMLKIINEIITAKGLTKGKETWSSEAMEYISSAIEREQLANIKTKAKEMMIAKIAAAEAQEAQEKAEQEKIETERAKAAQEKEEEARTRAQERAAEREAKKEEEKIVIEEPTLLRQGSKGQAQAKLVEQQKEQEAQAQRELTENVRIEQERKKAEEQAAQLLERQRIEETAQLKAEEERKAIAEAQKIQEAEAKALAEKEKTEQLKKAVEAAAAQAAEELAQSEHEKAEKKEAREQTKRKQVEEEKIEKEQKAQQEATLAKEKIEREAEAKEQLMDETRKNIAKAFNTGTMKTREQALADAANNGLQVIFIHPGATQSINYVQSFKDITFSGETVLKFSELPDGSIIFVEQGNDKLLSPIIIYPDKFSSWSKDTSMLVNIPKDVKKLTVTDTQGKEKFEKLLTHRYNRILQSNLDFYKQIVEDTKSFQPSKNILNAQKMVGRIQKRENFSINEVEKLNTLFLNLGKTNEHIKQKLAEAETQKSSISIREIEKQVKKEEIESEKIEKERIEQEQRAQAEIVARKKEEQATIEKIQQEQYQKNAEQYIKNNRAEIIQAITDNDFKALNTLLRLDIINGLQVIFIHPDATECINYIKELQDVTIAGKKLLEFSQFKDGSLLLIEQSNKPQVIAIYPRDLLENIFSSDYSILATIPSNLITKERDNKGLKILREIFTAKANQMFKSNIEQYKGILDAAESLGVTKENTQKARAQLEKAQKEEKLLIDDMKGFDSAFAEIEKTNELTRKKTQEVVPQEVSIPMEKIREQATKEIKETKKAEELAKTVVTPQVPVQTPVAPTTIVAQQPVQQPAVQTEPAIQQPVAPIPMQQQYSPGQYQVPIEQQPWIGAPQGVPMEYWQYYLQQPGEIPTAQPWQIPVEQQYSPEAPQNWDRRQYLQSAQSWWQGMIQRYLQPEAPVVQPITPATPSAVGRPPVRERTRRRLIRSQRNTGNRTAPAVQRTSTRRVGG